MNTALQSEHAGNPAAVGDFVPAPLLVFKASCEFDVDLYLLAEGSGEPALFRSHEYEIDAAELDRLEKKGTQRLYVRKSEYGRYLKQLRDQVGRVVANASLSPEERFFILKTAVATEIQHAFKLIDASRAVQVAADVSAHLIEALDGGEASASKLFQVMRHDYHTFNHLVNVASFGLLLAERLGVKDKAQLQEIAVGGMLHDIGKRHIPREVLLKPGRLSREEQELVERHPTTGYVDLHGQPGVTRLQLMMVYQHHERLDGAGYPVGVTAPDIHFAGRLCSVVDVFDALTSKRVYRSALPVESTLTYMNANAGTQFDKEMVQCWTSAIRNK